MLQASQRVLLLQTGLISCLLLAVNGLAVHCVHANLAYLQTKVRVAVVGFGSNSSGEIERAVDSELVRLSGIIKVERSMVVPAVAGIGYNYSVNMSKEEARRLGGAIGCDFYIVGKAEVLSRSEAAKEVHQEGLVAVMIVDGRTGALAHFDLVAVKAETADAARSKAAAEVARRTAGYVEKMISFRDSREALLSQRQDTPASGPVEAIEEIPAEGSSRLAGFKAPEFLNRVKPDYTAEAERADVTATVEALAVLRSNGEIGDVEVTKWAGFGLDESAVKAIRQLKFKPATRDSQPISVRALIRYNFRRSAQ
jgi:TonB family protein